MKVVQSEKLKRWREYWHRKEEEAEEEEVEEEDNVIVDLGEYEPEEK